MPRSLGGQRTTEAEAREVLASLAHLEWQSKPFHDAVQKLLDYHNVRHLPEPSESVVRMREDLSLQNHFMIRTPTDIENGAGLFLIHPCKPKSTDRSAWLQHCQPLNVGLGK